MRAEGEHRRADDEDEALGRLRHRALTEDAHLRALVRERLAGTEAALAEAVGADAGIPAAGLAAQAFAAATISLLLGLRARFIDPEAQREFGDLDDGFALLRGALAAVTRR